MYCPKCRSEYREGFTKCADCDVPLINELPPEPKSEFLDLEEVLSTADPGQIALAKSLLDRENIRYVVQGEHFSAMQPSIPVRFLVPRGELKKAKVLLKNI